MQKTLTIVFLLTVGFAVGWSAANIHFVHHAHRPPKVEGVGSTQSEAATVGDDVLDTAVVEDHVVAVQPANP